MANNLITNAKKVLAGKGGILDDEEQEYLAHEITKLGFKIGFARAYAAGPTLLGRMIKEIERQQKELNQIRKLIVH